jgi:hypothetical protein
MLLQAGLWGLEGVGHDDKTWNQAPGTSRDEAKSRRPEKPA